MLIKQPGKLLKKGSKGLAQVREVFGDEAIDENGEMNRRYMGDLESMIQKNA